GSLRLNQDERLSCDLPVQRHRLLQLGPLFGAAQDLHGCSLHTRILGGPGELAGLGVLLGSEERGAADRVGNAVGSEAHLTDGVIVVPRVTLPGFSSATCLPRLCAVL